jgi:solute carrier family 32 (vesicular inhibitory amino acid transporter)
MSSQALADGMRQPISHYARSRDPNRIDVAPLLTVLNRGSVTHRLAAVADIGGVNSIRSFARSWQRAAGFPEVIPRRPSFVFAPDQQPQHPSGSSEDIQYGRGSAETQSQRPQGGLLRQHLESSLTAGEPSDRPDAGGSDFRDRESKALDAELGSTVSLMGGSPSSRSSFFAAPALSSPPVIGSYGSYRSSAYGTMGRGSLRVRHMSSTDQLGDRWAEQGEQASEDGEDDDAALGEHQPILVKEVKQGNKVILTVEGQSTLPQSIFNSINALIGVGMLSLPLAFKMSGWIFGLLLLTVNAAVTGYTGKILARCMDYDPSLITYSDIAYVSFGSRARIIVSALFSIELVAACVALVILFSDSLYLLLPGLFSVETWKCICGVLVLVLNTMPLRWLSYTSVIGIFSTFSSELSLEAHRDEFCIDGVYSCLHCDLGRSRQGPQARFPLGASHYISPPLKLARSASCVRSPS